jgi:hypothetical protein
MTKSNDKKLGFCTTLRKRQKRMLAIVKTQKVPKRLQAATKA